MKPKITSRRAHHFAMGLLDSRSVVIDLGANLGHFSSELLDECECTCYAIEAVPSLYHKIVQRPGLRSFNLAICETDGPVEFHVSSQEESGSMSQIPDTMMHETIQVEGISLKSFLKTNEIERVDLLKMDIEGAEIPLLLSIDNETLSKIGQITVEFHDFLPYFDHHQDIIAIKEKLNLAGFECLKYSMKCNADVLFINRATSGLSRLQIAQLKWIDRYIRAAKRLMSNA